LASQTIPPASITMVAVAAAIKPVRMDFSSVDCERQSQTDFSSFQKKPGPL
jgi:hypothetical protein